MLIGISTAISASFGALVASTTDNMVSALTVASDGWTATGTITNAVVGGSYVGLNNGTTPGLTITVSSKSWTTAGVETTTSRTIIATAVKRKVYPNETSLEEATSGSDINVIFALSDVIYSNDTITDVSVEAGFFTDDGAGGSSATNSGGTVDSTTNSSTVAYPKPVPRWLNSIMEVAESSTHTVRLAVDHAHGQSSLPVRAVKFTATDESTNSVTTTVSSMSSYTSATTGLYVPCFSWAIDLSSLTAEETITVDAVVYPWVGDAFTISTDASSYGSANLAVMKFFNDKSLSYGRSYAYVDATSGNDGTGVASTTAGTAAASPFQTISAAVTAAVTVNNSSNGRNNTAGVIIRLVADTYVGFGADLNPADGTIPMIIEAANPANKATTILQTNANVANNLLTPTTLKDITIDFATDARVIDGTTSLFYNFNNVTFTTTTGTLTQGFANLQHATFTECDGSSLAGNFLQPFQTTHFDLFLGCDFAFATTVRSTFFFAALGSHFTNLSLSEPTAISSLEKPIGAMVGWSFITHLVGGFQAVSVYRSSLGARGLSLSGSLFERAGTASAAAIDLFGEADDTTCENVLFHHSTLVGARTNCFYNDQSTIDVSRIGRFRNSVVYEFNCKADFYGPNSHVGSFQSRYHVGWANNSFVYGDSNVDGVGYSDWLGELVIHNEAYGTDASPITADWTDDQSVTGGNAGGGTYTPGASTALQTVAAADVMFPIDLYGTTIPTDGSAYAGAAQ